MQARHNSKASYRGFSSARLEEIRPHVMVRVYSDDWLERDRARRELEQLDHALKLARKREAKKGNPGRYRLEYLILPSGKWMEAMSRDRLDLVKKRASALLRTGYHQDKTRIVDTVTGEKIPVERIHRNPRKGHFARCVKAVSKRGGAVDPRAVCGGQEKKYRANAKIYVQPSERFKGKWQVGKVGYPVETRKSKRGAISWAKRWQEPGDEIIIQENPAAASAQAYQEFHGRPPDELIEVKEQIHHHKYLPSAGKLRMLKVEAIDGKHLVTLSRFGNAMLCFNERMNQLFVKNGDQSVDLKAFGIEEEHEVHTLGKVTHVDYFTTKDHLGSDGGTAIYRHKFRTVNEDGKVITVKIYRCPDLIYYALDKRLVFSGGSYQILREGIDR